MKKFCTMVLFICTFLLPLLATTLETEDTNEDGKPDRWIETGSEGHTIIKSDRNYDGNIDHILEIDEAALKVSELMDFNFDGEMDDFSYFERGVLQTRQIDTNYDDEIDIWVHMHRGVYVRKVERDTDFDGEIDYTRDYESP